MKVKFVLLIAVAMMATAVAVLPLAASAQNADPNAKATFVSSIKTYKKGKTAALRVTYQCNAGDVVWVSAKQTKSGKKSSKLKKGGSSKASSGWLQSHRNKFVCDTKSHTGRFTIDKVEPGSKGKLRKGYAWVQFCVTTGTTEADSKLILSKSGWVKVK